MRTGNDHATKDEEVATVDTILVTLIVLGAALFLARWFFRNLISRDKKPTCGSCDTCAPTENSEPDKTPTASSSS